MVEIKREDLHGPTELVGAVWVRSQRSHLIASFEQQAGRVFSGIAKRPGDHHRFCGLLGHDTPAFAELIGIPLPAGRCRYGTLGGLAVSLRSNPAVTGIECRFHSGDSRKPEKRAGPSNFSSESQQRVRTVMKIPLRIEETKLTKQFFARHREQ